MNADPVELNPGARVAAARGHGEALTPSRTGRPCRSLLVEKDDGDARLIQELLRDPREHSVTRVATCQDALAELDAGDFDVALVDLSIPDDGGVSIVHTLMNAAPGLPLIGLTGVSDETLSLEAIHAGAQDYLAKGNVNREVLSRSIRYAVERMRNARRLAHLNRVLSAIRSVNRLIVRDQDPQSLSRATCKALVETGGYDAAWIALYDNGGIPQFFAQHGWAAREFEKFETAWRAGSAPACVLRLSRMAGSALVAAPSVECDECALSVPNGAVAASLRHGASVYGVLCVSFPTHIGTNDEEAALVREIADDLGLGIQNTRLEVARKKADARYSALFENANVAILVATEGTVIVEANPQAASLFAAPSAAALYGMSAFDLVAAESRDGLRRRVRDLAARGVVQAVNAQIRRFDGTLVTVDASVSAITIGDERVLFVVLQNVTERQKLQAQVLISDRMASVGTLAAGVAHEINNPLAVVLANLEFAVKESAQLGTGSGPSTHLADLQEALRDGREAAERVRQIVKDLKIFSREEGDKRTAVDVERVLDSSLRMAWNEIRHRAKLVKNYAGVARVEASESRLGQVFLNLAVNAAQAIPEGHADRNEIVVTTSTDENGRVIVEIRDTGCGIPREIRKMLFTPFFTTKPQGVGTGLGLAICHRIIAGIGGEISVESEVGRGSSFRVALPAARMAAAAEAVAPAVQLAARRGRVLVIDDEPMIGSVVRRILSTEHEVTVVTSAQEALARISAGENFDVILCDLMMPVMTGMEFYAALEQSAPEQVERVVLLTGGAFTAAARTFLDKVPNARVEKPFESQKLRGVVNERIR